MSDFIDKDVINESYETTNFAFNNFLYNTYNKIKPYSSEDIDSFDKVLINKDVIAESKSVLKCANKSGTIRMKKLFDNERVTLTDDNKIRVTLDKTLKPCKIAINTGLVFQVPLNQTMCISLPFENQNVNMNSIFIDNTIHMPIILFIETDGTVDSCVLNMDLFVTVNSKYKIDGVKQSPFKGIIKNLKRKNDQDDEFKFVNSKVKSKNVNVVLNNKDIEVCSGSSLFLTCRKRFQNSLQIPTIGFVFKDVNADVKFISVNNLPMKTFQLSFVVVHGYYNSLEIADVNTKLLSVNGGYNGWCANYDYYYDEVVQLFKLNYKFIKNLKFVKSLLENRDWDTDENIDFIMKNCNMANLKEIKKSMNMKVSNFKEFMEHINVTPDNICLNQLILNNSINLDIYHKKNMNKENKKNEVKDEIEQSQAKKLKTV
ncbi:KM727_gp61-like protein [Aratus pisonii nudivirus]|nr:KM727_gp61-like protein [Aratus pisonii nudivirus]